MTTVILGTIDAGGEGHSVLMAAVNQKLGTNYALTEFNFSDPVAVAVPTPTHNTMIRMVPYVHSGYYGSRKVYYNRIHVTELGQISVVRGNAVNVTDLLAQINEKLGILIKPTDIYDAVLPAAIPGETSVAVDLNFRETSVIFYGGTKIVLGNNDPSTSTGGTTAPFKSELSLFATVAQTRYPGLSTPEQVVIDHYSVGIDADKQRKRFNYVADDSAVDSFEVLYKRYMDANLWNTVGVDYTRGCWIDNSGATFVINCFGECFKINNNGTAPTLVSKVVTLDLENTVVTDAARLNSPVHLAFRNLTGDAYALASTTNGLELLKSIDGALTWTSEHTFTGSNCIGYQNANWLANKLTIKEHMVHAGKLWTLVDTQELYTPKPGSTGVGPAVEVLDLTTFATDYFTLEGIATEISGLVVDYENSQFTLVTPEADTVTTPKVAAILAIKNTQRLAIGQYRFEVDRYKLQTIETSGLHTNAVSDPHRFISSYSLKLQKSANFTLDVIEVGGLVPVDTLPYEAFATLNHDRTQTGYLTYGVNVYTSVRTLNGRTPWQESLVALGDGAPHRRVLVQTAQKRMHFIAQPENALVRMKFTEDNGISNFRASADNAIALDKHAGFNYISAHACGVYFGTTLTETVNSVYPEVVWGDTESVKDDVNFSFITKDVNSKYRWFAAATVGTTLVERKFGTEYNYIGSIPLSVASDGTNLYAWSAISSGIFKSANAGKAWTHHCETEVYYDQKQSDKPERNIWGRSAIEVKPEHFKASSFLGNEGYYELKFNETAKVTDSVLKSFAVTMNLNATVLAYVSNTYAPADNGYTPKNQLASYGINFLGQYAPYNVQAWEALSATNTVSGVSKYTVNSATPLDTEFGRTTLNAAIPAGVTPIHINSKVLYLDIKQVVYGTEQVNGNAVHSLYVVDKNDVLTKTELFGGSIPANATFKPSVMFALWEHQETNYVPFVYVQDKKVMLLNRIKEDGKFDITTHVINVPTDNGAALVPIPLLNSNRREYYFYQKNNGIFKLSYSYISATKTTVFSLVRVFTLSNATADMDIITGCCRQAAAISEPIAPLVPTYPANGTLASTFCTGMDKWGKYNDGVGGTYDQLIQVNHVDCGYVAPAPTPVGANTATVNLNDSTATADLLQTTATTGEDQKGYVVYELTNPLLADADLILDVEYTTANAADIVSVESRVGAGAWNPVVFPQTITVPMGETEIVVRITYAEDHAVEGTETYTLKLSKAPASAAQFNNTASIDTVMTILDTSI